MAMQPKTFTVLSGLILFLAAAPSGWTQSGDQLKTLSIADLSNLEVITVSRVPTTRSMVPAAVHVIRQDDIRRMGAKSLPDVLRLIPGVQVAQIDANKWAVGIRGFSERLARSMLVLIDGRAVYSPLFAGTYWELQDTLLEDIDRIEVIRGPGGTLWGANAVNGVVNIITKNARDTQGGTVEIGGGSEEQGFGSVRYGGKYGQNLYYRAYGKFFNRDAAFHADRNNYDDWRMGRAGFRTDWTSSANRTITIQGDIYGGITGQLTTLTSYSAPFTQRLPDDADVAGGNLVGRWEGPLGESSNFRVQAYYDRTHREELRFQETRDTFDVDFQHNFALSEKQVLVWGAGYRASAGDTESVQTLQFQPHDRADNLFSWFAQDEIKLAPNKLHVTVGSKFEHNDYSGYEVQPSARLVWAFSPEHIAVFSVARAVRTPSRVEHDLELNNQFTAPQLPFAAFLRFVPNKQFEPEKLIAYEAGYRVRPAARLSVMLSTFINQHNGHLDTELGTAFLEDVPAPRHVAIPVRWVNNLHGNSHGLETTSDLRLTEWWRWTSSYSLLRIQMTRDKAGSQLSQEPVAEGNSPQHQFSFQSSMDLPGHLELDWMFRSVSALANVRVPRYATSDVRLGWQPHRVVEFSVLGRNLHDPRHPEFSPAVEIERSVLGQLTFRW
jgi:iron complex outermembrane recepter protein